jgi:outer membrane protein
MIKRNTTAPLLLLLTLWAMQSRLLYAADGAPAGNVFGSQAAVNGNSYDSNPLSAHAAVGDTPQKTAPASKDWTIRIGAGAMMSPAFVGSSDYQMMAVPALKVTYRNSFFASVEDGVGYAVINQQSWRAGPIAKIEFGRKEDGDNPFRFAGGKTSALHGLGTVATTIETGGFVEYRWSSMSTKIGVRKGLNGHEGLVGDLSVRHRRTSQALSPVDDVPLVVSLGPRLTVVDSTYNKAFFGVEANQAVNSGLPRYSPRGGILSYGIGSFIVVPMGKQFSAMLLAGYDRLTGDAGNSPLVRERGSPNQAMLGVLLSYEFGLGSYGMKEGLARESGQ